MSTRYLTTRQIRSAQSSRITTPASVASAIASAGRLYAEAAQNAPNLAERDHLTRQAARLNARRCR
jgi:hypothetical protein